MVGQNAQRVAEESAFDEVTLSRLRDIEDGHPWFTARNRLIAWALDRHAPTARSFLDLGCGTGLVMAALQAHRPHLELTGVEPTAEALQHASRRVPEARLVVASARSLGAVNAFDAVGAFDVLEHLEDDAEAVRALHEATRPGGVLLVTVPQHPWLWSPVDAASGHKRRYTRRTLRATLQQGGWHRIELLTSFVSLPLPAMALARVLRRRSQDVDLFRELRMSRQAGRILSPILTIERQAIQRGVKFPVGGSLLAVARRS
jgi:SAM-dependent methyltransferase